MTTLDLYRAILEQPVDGEQQPGHRWIWREADCKKVALRVTLARLIRLPERQSK